MTNERLEYYDPLLDTVVLERGLPRDRAHLRQPEEELDPRDIVRTPEFARLATLRQAGVAWLIFPSATHTRFAHAVGCWRLGRLAETLIRVYLNPGAPSTSLRSWMADRELREEFYLALLLRDIGRAPFDHILDRNPSFTAGLRSAGLAQPGHCHRAVALIGSDRGGSNKLADYWRNVAVPERYGVPSRLLKNVLSELPMPDATTAKGVSLPIVYYLMTGDESYLPGPPAVDEAVRLVYQIISGILDLDRLDHYARDAYFSGVPHSEVDPRKFLVSLRLRQLQREGRTEWEFRVTDDGAANVNGLLFVERQIRDAMFYHPRCLALRAMLECAVTHHLATVATPADECIRIALMDDEALLSTLAVSDSPTAKALSHDVRAIRPYRLVERWNTQEIQIAAERLDGVAAELAREDVQGGRPAILIHHDNPTCVSPGNAYTRWLDPHHLRLETDGTKLTEHPVYGKNLRFYSETSGDGFLWLFSAPGVADDVIAKAKQRLGVPRQTG